ncbi:DUF1828 domain-containing protein [Aerococcus kribbianus]|uniref:DUF1828 domain-containing protein n=1 Tax=Aerococcus kribbianus TaxID=2999064 RepID=A0A9X3FQI0_9LACT|nr:MULTISPECIES: DUF1828 domain-containing protein [unclassified Aerococcus]MCZ0717869.1 DUF1828 domain-containing protein [Aerococcus sp. YH-aer221]MCZ0726156.1 DUF1828 domain-containing protein [Aerococcus sp. YH-aer222]
MDVEKIKDDYMNFIKENTKINIHENEIISINTPFVDSFGEGISFSIEHNDRLYKVTDNGFAYWELGLAGIDLSRKGKRKEIFNNSITFHGFSLGDNNEIYRLIPKKEISQSIHDMTQLLINIYDLTYLSRHNVADQFYQDVDSYFNNSDRFNFFQDFSLTGKSQLNHRFNYVFIQDKINKLARVHTRLDKQQVNSILTSWLDTSLVRKPNEELYIILSEEGFQNVSEENLIALDSYKITPLNFNDKDNLVRKLGA